MDGPLKQKLNQGSFTHFSSFEIAQYVYLIKDLNVDKHN